MKDTVKTKYGYISGIRRDGCIEFLGIPFAAPPTGKRAFRRPAEPEPWDGVLKAHKGRANPVQAKGVFSADYVDEDCLYLNVYMPDTDRENLPVMVWIHGGAYSVGGTGASGKGSDRMEYDLSLYARETETAVVTVNYRLNFYGFLNLHYLSDRFDMNCGLYDQIAALRFVKENIAAFGGDENNITLFGQSAGAASVLALMTMPEAEELFDRSIVMSACVDHFFTEEESRENTRDYLKRIGVSENEPERLLSVTPRQVMSANNGFELDMLKRGEIRCAFSPVVDGITLKEMPKTAVVRSKKPMLIGSVLEEGNLHIGPVPTAVIPFIARKAGIKVPLFGGDYRKRASDAVTNHVYRAPMEAILKDYAGPAWRYEYRHTTPDNKENGKGCFHAADVPVLMGVSVPFERVDDPETVRVGRHMRAVWSRFAYTGDPGWELYRDGGKIEILE